MYEMSNEFLNGQKFIETQEFEKAELCFLNVLETIKKQDYSYMLYLKIGYCQYRIGFDAKNVSKLESAIQYLQKAKSYTEIAKNTSDLKIIKKLILKANLELRVLSE